MCILLLLVAELRLIELTVKTARYIKIYEVDSKYKGGRDTQT